MLTTVNVCYGNVLYMVRRAILAWLQLVQPLAFFRMQDGGLGLSKGFPGWGIHFLSVLLDTGPKSRSNQRSKIKFDWTQFKLEDIGYINVAVGAAPRLTAD